MKIFFSCVCLLFAVALCPAQGNLTNSRVASKPDLSGTWQLDFSSSEFGSSKRDLAYDKMTLIIFHRDPEFRIIRKWGNGKKEYSTDLLYYTDGRGETNLPWGDKNSVNKSTTKWDGDRLFSNGTLSTNIFVDVLVSKSTDKWEISTDKNILICHSYIAAPRSTSSNPTVIMVGDTNVKKVFKRVK